LADGGLLIRGAAGRVFGGVQLEAVAGVVVGLDVVAGQAGERNTAARRVSAVAFAGVVWLLADVSRCWYRNTGTAGSCTAWLDCGRSSCRRAGID